MAEATHLSRLEEICLSSKHEIATLKRGLAEANERITDTQSQLTTIEKLIRENLLEKEQSKPQSEQEIIAAEIQAKIEEDQEIQHKATHQQFSKNEPEADAEILDQENFQRIQIHTNLPSQLQVEGEAKFTDQDPNPNTAEQQLISQLNSKKNRSEFQSITRNRERKDESEVELDAPESVDGDATDGFKDRRAGEGSKLVKMVVAQRPPPEPPNLNAHTTVEAEREPSALELLMREQRLHHHPTAAAGSTEKGRSRK
ncbi:hypothetical protein PIB30_015228 [Stylosanthes scabra]|uniref:Uncharacterized protein n=1 Tax=Stylosanthes scabra TaxID=79078 RepID=A0ABU6X4H5_9FABA|nr:hypothetical protein [Stylosanthes scabra]